jgi:hypothetical protein
MSEREVLPIGRRAPAVSSSGAPWRRSSVAEVSMSRSWQRERGERAGMVQTWCDVLDRVRDQARAHGDDFLAFLVEAALEHAIGLAMRERGGRLVPDAER